MGLVLPHPMDIDRMLDVFEKQLCQAIVWSEAIQAVSAIWNQNADARNNCFIIDTVRDAEFDQNYGIHVSAITDELKRIEKLLGKVRGLLRRASGRGLSHTDGDPP
jgi:hypothetical protein